MFSARNLHNHYSFKPISSLFQLQSNLFRNVVPLGQGIDQSKIGDKVEAYHKVSFYCYVKPLNLLIGSLCRGMSTIRGKSMRSKVERRMQKESGKTLREIRKAKKITKKLMTDEERLVYNLKRALFKARFEQALESQKLNIKKIEQDLRRMGVNPEDPTAMASIQRVASTFFNAIDKKDGSPYVNRGDKLSVIEPNDGLEESDPSADTDQEELDRFIADIEDAADKEYEAEEAKEKEEFGRLRYWNREEYGGRFRRLDDSRNDAYDGEVRGSRVRQNIHPKHRTADSDDEKNAHSDNDDDDDEWHPGNIADDSDVDSNFDGSDEARGRFKESRGRRERINNISIGNSQVNGGQSRHGEAKFRRNMGVQDSESEDILSQVENAMWESDLEDNDSVHLRGANSNNFKSSSSDDEGQIDDFAQYRNSFNAQKSLRGKQAGIIRTKSVSMDAFSGSEDWMFQSEGEDDSRGDDKDYPTSQKVVKSDIHKKRSPKEDDEAWDSD